MVLASWGRLYFSKMVAIIPPIPQALLTKWHNILALGAAGQQLMSLLLEHAHTEFGGSGAMWLVMLDDKNAMHFHHVFLVRSLLESSSFCEEARTSPWRQTTWRNKQFSWSPKHHGSSNTTFPLCLLWIPDPQNHAHYKIILFMPLTFGVVYYAATVIRITT